MSVSSPAVIRNLFFFPGSFFDLLKQHLKEDTSIRIVLLVPVQFLEKYTAMLGGGAFGDALRIEGVAISAKKSFIQKVFYFLYSYLVFTGTTKVMATMGTRPDEPPAGGKWYLAPFKTVIAHTAGRSRWIKTALVPRLHLVLFGERPFAELFGRYKPSLVFVPHLYGWFDTLLLAEAKQRGTSTIGMPAGWDHLDKYFLPFRVDRLLVASEQIKEMAMRHQAYGDGAITITGYPHLDFVVRYREFLLPRAELFASLGFPADAKIILYVSGSAYCRDEPEIIETIIRWADEGKFGADPVRSKSPEATADASQTRRVSNGVDVRIVIRPYVGGRGRDRAFDEEKFNRFAEHPRVAFYRREFWGDLEKSKYFVSIMYHADAVIAMYTTMALEAAALDRPLIAPGFDGYHRRPYHRSIRRFEEFDHFRGVLKSGGLLAARSFDELFRALDGYLKNPSRDCEKRDELRRVVCGPLDGNASRRIFDAVFRPQA